MFKRLTPVFLLYIGVLLCAVMTLPVWAEDTRGELPGDVSGSSAATVPTPVASVVDSANSLAHQSVTSPAIADDAASGADVMPEPDDESTGAPVMLSGRTLFYIYADSTIYSAAQRAEIVSQRLIPLLRKIEEKKIRIRYENNIAVLVRGKLTLMTITPQDAMAAQIALPQLAEYYCEQSPVLRQKRYYA